MHVDKSCCFSLSLSPFSSVKIAPGSGEKQDTIQVQKRAPLHTQIYIYIYISYHITSHHITSHHIISYHIISYLSLSLSLFLFNAPNPPRDQ